LWIDAVETAEDKQALKGALAAAFEFISAGEPVAVTRTMVDNVWDAMKEEDFEGFTSITQIQDVATT
jgi:hypothetical protein